MTQMNDDAYKMDDLVEMNDKIIEHAEQHVDEQETVCLHCWLGLVRKVWIRDWAVLKNARNCELTVCTELSAQTNQFL